MNGAGEAKSWIKYFGEKKVGDADKESSDANAESAGWGDERELFAG